ncbi:hypothetical protein BD560DRAFT_490688 [Blakeslea trispora]|nr:hypothetical protein BD560DRAFT_490688 [Blakeslea trispora]
MPILLNYKDVNKIERRSPIISLKVEDVSPHASQKHHSLAFNAVHIIAAVIGIAGAIAAAVTIFLLCKRKRSKSQTHINKAGTKNEQSSNSDDVFTSQINSTHSYSNSQTNHPRFDQFANDFDGNNGSSDRTFVSTEDISPTMQQYQLQLKLLQQQQSQLAQAQSHSRQQTVAVSNNSLSPPPPPYCP